MVRTDFLEEKFGLEKHTFKNFFVFSGKVGGYYTVIELDEGTENPQYFIKFGVNLEEVDITQEEFSHFAQKVSDKFKPDNIEYQQRIYVVYGKQPKDDEALEKLLSEMMEFLVNHFKASNYGTGDFFNSHDDGTLALYSLGGSYFILSDRSYESAMIRSKEAFPEEVSIISGLGGAVLGALLGAVLGVFISSFVWANLFYDYYGWIIALPISFFAYRFYRKKNGIISTAGILSILGVIAFVLLLSNLFVHSIYFAFTFGNPIFSILSGIQYMLRYDLNEYQINVLVGIITASIYGFVYYRYHHITAELRESRKIE